MIPGLCRLTGAKDVITKRLDLVRLVAVAVIVADVMSDALISRFRRALRSDDFDGFYLLLNARYPVRGRKLVWVTVLIIS